MAAVALYTCLAGVYLLYFERPMRRRTDMPRIWDVFDTLTYRERYEDLLARTGCYALTGALRSLFAVVENYPELKANENVLSLQEQLTTTENQISFSRQHYNATVLDYNTNIQTFPSVLIAGILGFSKRDFFDAEPEAETVPNVDLSLS